ncbi:hypothetical protein [Saccharopolyspora sp. 7B]|nr:hypothetical protein [Saccharopolyspora sp. 7B]MCA1282950.1 hypothetical protein [Saccharopolyspora sp. 7B]
MPKVSASWALAVAALIAVVLVVLSGGEPVEPRHAEFTGVPAAERTAP